jgi:hypothetical protein
VKFSPNGTALSPPVTGFTGMGVDGVGWGTGVALDKVWVTSFNGKIGLFTVIYGVAAPVKAPSMGQVRPN